MEAGREKNLLPLCSRAAWRLSSGMEGSCDSHSEQTKTCGRSDDDEEEAEDLSRDLGFGREEAEDEADVADSSGEAEYQETLDKAAAIFELFDG